MSVKTRERKASLTSNTTDFTDVPNRFIPQKQFQNQYQTSNVDDLFPPNDFIPNSSALYSNASKQPDNNQQYPYNGQLAQTEEVNFRPDQRMKIPIQQKFAPQAKEEGESLYSQSYNQPFKQQYYPQKENNILPQFHQQNDRVRGAPMDQHSNSSQINQNQQPYIQQKYQEWTPKPPLPQFNENRIINPLDHLQNIQQNSSQSDTNIYKNTLQNLFIQSDCLPQEVLFLLAEEDNHISKYRNKVEKEKAKVENDIDLIKTEFINLFEELKISMQNYIDDHYKRYIGVYAAFKVEIIQLKQQKLSAPLHLTQPLPKADLTNASNQNLIRELEEISYQTQLSKLNQYVGDLNKTRKQRIVEISKDLLQITSSSGNLYNTESSQKQLGLIKDQIRDHLTQGFSQMSNYVQPLDYLINNDKQQSRISNQQSEQEVYHHPHHFPNQNININERIQPQNNQHINFQERAQAQIQHYKEDSQKSSNNQSKNQSERQQYKIRDEPVFSAPFPISQQQTFLERHQLSTHIGRAPALSEQIQLRQAQVVRLNHSQMPLCFLPIKDELMATGSRDGKIKIWDGSREIKQFSEHIGGVCCLAMIKQQDVPIYMISGSDHVDNSILVWDLQTFSQVGVLNGHSAAVVALLSLEDGYTIVSASYDKSLLVWGIDSGQQQAVQKLGSAHTNAVTSLSLTPQRQHFISGGLDCLLNIWKIKYGKDGRFESALLEKTLKNVSIVCSLSSYTIKDQLHVLVGSKDGKLREWNVSDGSLERQVAVCSGPIVEMILFMGGQTIQVLSMSTKDKNLIITNLENGENQVVDVQESINVEFGCGVFPKMSLLKEQLVVLSQSDTNQNITRYHINWQ